MAEKKALQQKIIMWFDEICQSVPSGANPAWWVDGSPMYVFMRYKQSVDYEDPDAENKGLELFIKAREFARGLPVQKVNN